MKSEKIILPYGRETVAVEIEEGHLAGVLRSGIHGYKPPVSGEELVRAAMAQPLGTPRLRELVAGKRKIVVIASDHTRPVPSRVIMPQMLAEIRAGNPSADITILVATGLHRTTTPDELATKFGDEIVARERIVVHDCDDAANLGWPSRPICSWRRVSSSRISSPGSRAGGRACCRGSRAGRR